LGFVCAESDQALEDSYSGVEQILTGYILEINEVDAENIRDTEAMNKRLAGMLYLDMIWISTLGERRTD
jgi:hypothetical protein